MADEVEPLTTAQVIEHLDHVQDVVRDEIKFPDKLLNEGHWQMIANALDRLRELDEANGKLGQRATAAEHNCASARALAKQSLEKWVALEAQNAQLEAAQKPKPMSEAPMNGSGFWAVDGRGRKFRLRSVGRGWECAYLPFNPMRHEMVGCRP